MNRKLPILEDIIDKNREQFTIDLGNMFDSKPQEPLGLNN